MTIHQTIQFITRKINKHFILVFLLLSNALFAQNYPVTCTPIVRPSYSLKWSEISTNSEMFKVHLLLKDLTKPSVDVYLKIRLSGVGVDIRTIDGFVPSQTLKLIPGQAVLLAGSDLAEYFNISNLVVDGIDISALYAGGSLPEGLYTWTVEAYEIDRNRQVSNTGIALMNVFKNYPPIINIPQDGTILPAGGVPLTSPQNILFSWTSRSTASLNAAQGKTYTLRIYELNDGDDPNVVAYSGITPFREIVSINPYFLYGAAEPILNKGKRYAVQVQEVDVNGLDEYENEGKSQVVNFSYGKPCVAPEGLVINPIGKGRVELTYQASPENEETYPITAWYKTTVATIWNSVPVNGNNAVISELRDKTEYEFKLSSACGDNTSTMSALRAGDMLPSDDPSTTPETFTIDDSAFDEEIDELDPAILDPYTIGVELDADGTTRPVETLDSVFNKIIKPKCVTDADVYAECSSNHPDAPTIVGIIELDALAVGDVLGIYDYAVLVTAIGGGHTLSGKGLVKLPFLDNSYMAVEFSGVKAKKGEVGTQGGCVYEVGDYFRTRPISQTELQNEQVRTIADIIKLTEPTVFHGDLEVVIQKYQEKGNEIANKGTATLQEKQDLLTYTKGVEVAVGTWKDKFSEVFGSGETDPKVAEILGDMTAILTQLNADKQTIEAGTTYPIIPNLKEKIDAIIEKIKALQEENTPKPPKIQNVLATNINSNDATITWQGDPRFSKYVISYKTADGGELIETVNSNRLTLKKLQENSAYGFKIEGYVGDEVVDTYYDRFSTIDDLLPKPENIKTEINDNGNIVIKWDKNKLHQGFILKYKDETGEEKIIYPNKNEAEIIDFKKDTKYTFTIVAVGKNKLLSDPNSGDFDMRSDCPYFQKFLVYSEQFGNSKTVVSGTEVTIKSFDILGGNKCYSTIVWYLNNELIGSGNSITTRVYERINTFTAKCSQTYNGKDKPYIACQQDIIINAWGGCEITSIKASKTTVNDGEEILLTRQQNCLNAQSSYWTDANGNIISTDQNLLVTPKVGKKNKWYLYCVNGNEKCMSASPNISFIYECSKNIIFTPRIDEYFVLFELQGCSKVANWEVSSNQLKLRSISDLKRQRNNLLGKIPFFGKLINGLVELVGGHPLLSTYSFPDSYLAQFSDANTTFIYRQPKATRNPTPVTSFTITATCENGCVISKSFDNNGSCENFECSSYIAKNETNDGKSVEVRIASSVDNNNFSDVTNANLANKSAVLTSSLVGSIFNVLGVTAEDIKNAESQKVLDWDLFTSCDGYQFKYYWDELGESGINKIIEKKPYPQVFHITKSYESRAAGHEGEVRSCPQKLEVMIPAISVKPNISNDFSLQTIKLENQIEYIFPANCQNEFEEGFLLLESPTGYTFLKNSDVVPIKVLPKPWYLKASCILSGNVYVDTYEGVKSKAETNLEVMFWAAFVAKLYVNNFTEAGDVLNSGIVNVFKSCFPNLAQSAVNTPNVLAEPSNNFRTTEITAGTTLIDNPYCGVKNPNINAKIATSLGLLLKQIHDATQFYKQAQFKFDPSIFNQSELEEIASLTTFFPLNNDFIDYTIKNGVSTKDANETYLTINVTKKVLEDLCHKIQQHGLGQNSKEILCKLYNEFKNNGINLPNPSEKPSEVEDFKNGNCASMVSLWGNSNTTMPSTVSKDILANNNALIQSAGDGECLENNNLVVTATPKQPTCKNNDGEISVSATSGTGNLEYQLSTSTTWQVSNVFNNLKPGTYTVFVKDRQGNNGKTAITLNQNTTLSVNSTIDFANCTGQTTNTITLNVTGGNAPYNYSVNNGASQTSNIFNGLAFGTYNFEVKDSQGCTNTYKTEINDAYIMFNGKKYTSKDIIYVPKSNQNITLEAYEKNVAMKGQITWNGAVAQPTTPAIADFNRSVASTNASGTTVQVQNETSCTIVKIVVVDVVFSQSSNQVYGYDENDLTKEDCYITTPPSYNTTPRVGIPWKAIESNKSDVVKVEIIPSSISNKITFKTTNGCYTSTLGTLVSSVKTIGGTNYTVDIGDLSIMSNCGNKVESDLTFEVNGLTEVSNQIKLVSYSAIVNSLSLIVVHEENDDIAVYKSGQQTPSSQTIVVKWGNNAFLDTTPVGDDQIIIDPVTNESAIIAGKNKVCDTQANNQPLMNTGLPFTLNDLQSYLNKTVYNQSISSFNSIKIENDYVNFDLDNDKMIDVKTSISSNLEYQTLINKYSTRSGYVIVFIDNPNDGSFGWFPTGSNIGVVHPNTHQKPNRKQQMMNTVAHELGHGVFHLQHPFDQFTSCYGNGGKDKDNLEEYYDGDFLRKYQWVLIH